MNHAVIDIGSNTMRLSVYACQKSAGEIRALFSKKEMAGLAGYVTDGVLSEEGINRLITVLKKFQESLTAIKLEGIHVFATASLRNVSNTQAVLRQIARRTGYAVEVLSGEEEALLDFVGAVHSVGMDSGLLVDIGGGSTELTSFEHHVVRTAVSLPFGSLSLYTKYVSNILPDAEEQADIKRAVQKELKKLKPIGQADEICGVGGTIRAAFKLHDRWFGDAQQMSVESLSLMIERLKKPNKDLIRTLLKTAPDRIHTLIPGLIALQTIVNESGAKTILRSGYGVREGYLYHHVLGEPIRQTNG